MPAVPLLNIPAAAALSRLQRLAFPPAKDDARRSLLARRLALALAAAMALGSLLPTAILLRASHLNYPGGVALSRLHDLGPSTCQDGPVHIGNVAAMTGVTRFLQLGPPWAYSKVPPPPPPPRGLCATSLPASKSAPYPKLYSGYPLRNGYSNFDVWATAVNVNTVRTSYGYVQVGYLPNYVDLNREVLVG